jgi:hypothetical protein
MSEYEWKGWTTWDRIVAQETRLMNLGAEIATPIFECALMEPWKYSTKAHAIVGGKTLCGRDVPEDNPDVIALWTESRPRFPGDPTVERCKRCVKRAEGGDA